MARTPLLKRPLDAFYFVFFALHVPITLMMMMQLFPALRPFFPVAVQQFHDGYLETSQDTILLGGFGRIGRPGEFAWCTAFLYLETFVQLPMHFIAMYGLWKDSARIYLLMLINGASVMTSVLACLATLVSLPTTSDLTIKAGIVSLTEEQRMAAFQGYIPVGFIIPTLITVDMARRTLKAVNAGVRSAKKGEAKSS